MSSDGPLEAGFQAAIDRLIAAAGGAISVKSGYRSVEHQQRLFDAAVKKYGSPEKARRYVAPPGKSNHNKGIAADLEFLTPEARALAHRLAPQYGLVFPMSYEPWHIEPVGARGKADPQAYLVPPAGQMHPQDPNYLATRPDVMAATLAHALASPGAGENDSLSSVLSGEFPGDNMQRGTTEQTQGGTTNVALSGDTIDRFMAATRQHESGGNYKILTGAAKSNPSMTASGAYQVTNGTWNNYGGYKRAMDAPPEVQDKFIRERVQGFIDSGVTDPREWAAIWYTGHVPKSQAEWNSQPNKGLSVNEYADYIAQHMGG